MEDKIIYSMTAAQYPGAVAIMSFSIFDKKLLKIEFNDAAPEEFKRALGRKIPYNPDIFIDAYFKNCVIKDITNIDLSFKHFWTVYANKVGRITVVEKKWNKLDETDRILALGYIYKLRRFYEARKYDMPYPETYINGRYWESEIDF